HVRPDDGGVKRQSAANDQPRPVHRGAVPARRHALRALPHAQDGRLRRHGGAPETAGLFHGVHLPDEHRAARPERLRRRGAGADGGVRPADVAGPVPAAGGRRRRGHRPRGVVSTDHAAARLLRAGQGAAPRRARAGRRPQPPRVGGAAAHRGSVRRAGRLPAARARRLATRRGGSGQHRPPRGPKSGSGRRETRPADGGGGRTVNNEQVIAALLNVYPLIVPEAVLSFGACVLFLGGTFRPGRSLWGAAALVTLAAAGVALWFSPHSPVVANETRAALFAAPLYVDRLAVLIKAV